MAIRKSMLILMSLFCGSLAQGDVDSDIIFSLFSKNLEGKEITVKDFFHNLPHEDSKVFLASLDGDIGEVFHLDMASKDLQQACSHGQCKYCFTKFSIALCFEAKIAKTGFELTVTVKGIVIVHTVITDITPPPICRKVPILGIACVYIDKVNLKERSACVGIKFLMKIGPFKKQFNIQIKCFTIGKRDEL